jgi:GT2 family glycosyltransferase
MTVSTAVIIATKDRPHEVANLIDALALQTVPPDIIVISASKRNDIEQRIEGANKVQVLFGSPDL